MDERANHLISRFERWLNRYSIPSRLAGEDEISAQACQDEIDSLAETILRTAPVTGYERWLNEVLRELDATRKFPVWPSVHAITEAATVIANRTTPSARQTQVQFDPVEINARRIQRSEPVAEAWLCAGRRQDLLATGLVTEADFLKYLPPPACQQNAGFSK